MRICSKCLEIYGTSQYQFCPVDGAKTFDLASVEAEEFIIKKRAKNSFECFGVEK